MRRLFIVLDLSVLRGDGREGALRDLACAVGRAWGVFHSEDLSWGYALYDSTTAHLLLQDRLRKTAGSLKLPPAFQLSGGSDLRGGDLPYFLTLVDKATDEEYQDLVQDRRSKLAQLQQPTGDGPASAGEVPARALAGALQSALGGSFLRKLKDVAEHSSGSSAEGLILLFTPAAGTESSLHAFLGLPASAPADAAALRQALEGQLSPALLQRCQECCARLAWAPAGTAAEPASGQQQQQEPRRTRSGKGAAVADSGPAAEPVSSKPGTLGLLHAVVSRGGTLPAAVAELPQLAAKECDWGSFAALLGLPAEQPGVSSAPAERGEGPAPQLTEDVWPSEEESLELVLDTLKSLLAHLDGARQQEDIRRTVRQRYRQQQKEAAAAGGGPGGALKAGGRRQALVLPRGKGQAAVDQAKRLQEKEKENRRQGSAPNSAPVSARGVPSQGQNGASPQEEEVESVMALPLEEAAEELARRVSELVAGAEGSPRTAQMAVEIKKIVDIMFAAARKHSQQQAEEGQPGWEQIRAALLARVAPAAGLKLELTASRSPEEQVALQHKCVAQTLLRLHVLGAGLANGQELPRGQMSELEVLLQLVSATLHPIPKAGHDFFTSVVRQHFGAKFPGPLQRLAQELWEEGMEVDFDAMWEQAMAKDIGMEVSGETPGTGTNPAGQAPSSSAAAGGTVSGNPQRSGSVRTADDTGGRPGPSNLGRQLPLHREVSMREIVTSTRPSLAGTGSASKFSGDNSGVHAAAAGGGGRGTGAASKTATSKALASQNQLRLRALTLGQNNSWQFTVQRQDKKLAGRAPASRAIQPQARGQQRAAVPQHMSSRGAAQVAKAQQQGTSKGVPGAAKPRLGGSRGNNKVPDTPESHLKVLPRPPAARLQAVQEAAAAGGILSPPAVITSPPMLPLSEEAVIPDTGLRPPLASPPGHLAALRRAPSMRQLNFQGGNAAAAAAAAGAPGVIPTALPQESPEKEGGSVTASPEQPVGPTWLVAATQGVRGGLRRPATAFNFSQQLPPQPPPVQLPPQLPPPLFSQQNPTSQPAEPQQEPQQHEQLQEAEAEQPQQAQQAQQPPKAKRDRRRSSGQQKKGRAPLGNPQGAAVRMMQLAAPEADVTAEPEQPQQAQQAARQEGALMELEGGLPLGEPLSPATALQLPQQAEVPASPGGEAALMQLDATAMEAEPSLGAAGVEGEEEPQPQLEGAAAMAAAEPAGADGNGVQQAEQAQRGRRRPANRKRGQQAAGLEPQQEGADEPAAKRTASRRRTAAEGQQQEPGGPSAAELAVPATSRRTTRSGRQAEQQGLEGAVSQQLEARPAPATEGRPRRSARSGAPATSQPLPEHMAAEGQAAPAPTPASRPAATPGVSTRRRPLQEEQPAQAATAEEAVAQPPPSVAAAPRSSKRIAGQPAATPTQEPAAQQPVAAAAAAVPATSRRSARSMPSAAAAQQEPEQQPALEAPGPIAEPSTEQEEPQFGEAMVGHRIKVYWPARRGYLSAQILAFRPEDRSHQLQYHGKNIGTKWQDLSLEKIKFVGGPPLVEPALLAAAPAAPIQQVAGAAQGDQGPAAQPGSSAAAEQASGAWVAPAPAARSASRNSHRARGTQGWAQAAAAGAAAAPPDMVGGTISAGLPPPQQPDQAQGLSEAAAEGGSEAAPASKTPRSKRPAAEPAVRSTATRRRTRRGAEASPAPEPMIPASEAAGDVDMQQQQQQQADEEQAALLPASAVPARGGRRPRRGAAVATPAPEPAQQLQQEEREQEAAAGPSLAAAVEAHVAQADANEQESAPAVAPVGPEAEPAAPVAVPAGAVAAPKLGCAKCRDAALGCKGCRGRELAALQQSGAEGQAVAVLVGAAACCRKQLGCAACWRAVFGALGVPMPNKTAAPRPRPKDPAAVLGEKRCRDGAASEGQAAGAQGQEDAEAAAEQPSGQQQEQLSRGRSTRRSSAAAAAPAEADMPSVQGAASERQGKRARSPASRSVSRDMRGLLARREGVFGSPLDPMEEVTSPEQQQEQQAAAALDQAVAAEQAVAEPAEPTMYAKAAPAPEPAAAQPAAEAALQPPPEPEQPVQQLEAEECGAEPAAEPPAKKARLSSGSQGAKKTPRKKGLLLGMRKTSCAQGDEEVSQRPASSRLTSSRATGRQPSSAAALRATAASSPAPSRHTGSLMGAAAAGRQQEPQFNSPAAQLARRRSLDAAAAQQASPYSGTYDLPGGAASPAVSGGGSVGEAPGAAVIQASAGEVQQQPRSLPAAEREALEAGSRMAVSGPLEGFGQQAQAQEAAALGPTTKPVESEGLAVPVQAAAPTMQQQAESGGVAVAVQPAEQAAMQRPAESEGMAIAVHPAALVVDIVEAPGLDQPAAPLAQRPAESQGVAVPIQPAELAAAADDEALVRPRALLLLPSPPVSPTVPAALLGNGQGQQQEGQINEEDAASEDILSQFTSQGGGACSSSLVSDSQEHQGGGGPCSLLAAEGEISSGAAAAAPSPSTAAEPATCLAAAPPSAPGPSSAPHGAAAASALPQLSPLDLAGAPAATTAVTSQQEPGQARPAGRRLTEGKPAAAAVAPVAVGPTELSPRDERVAAVAADHQAGGTPASVQRLPHAQLPPPASVQHLRSAQLHRRDSTDSGMVLPLTAQQVAAQQAQQAGSEVPLELVPRQLFGAAEAPPGTPHWQPKLTPQPARAGSMALLRSPVAAAVQPGSGGFRFPALQQQQQGQGAQGQQAAQPAKSGSALTALRGAYAASSPAPRPAAGPILGVSPTLDRTLLQEPSQPSQDAAALLDSQPQPAPLSPAALGQFSASQQEALFSPGAAAAAANSRTPLRYGGLKAGAAPSPAGRVVASPAALAARGTPLRAGGASGASFPGYPRPFDVVWLQRKAEKGSPASSRQEHLRALLLRDTTAMGLNTAHDTFRTYSAVRLARSSDQLWEQQGAAPEEIRLLPGSWQAQRAALCKVTDWTVEGQLGREQAAGIVESLFQHGQLSEGSHTELLAQLAASYGVAT